MDNLIPVANQLQQILIEAGMFRELELPQIAVVGAQSTGKTTLLEALVGKSFLPKGDGMVTRCPLVLQLRKSNEEKIWAEFTNDKAVDKSTQRYELEDVKSEIERRTNDFAGTDKNVCNKAIFLSIFSPDVTELTLVDLPGIIKVPVEGQPEDIEDQVNGLIRHFVEKTSTIILAVSAANNDLANSDALKLAKEMDPTGDRTIGVITKCDLSPNPSQTIDYIKGKIFPLKMGYVGLSNVRDGGEFFQRGNLFKTVAHCCGNVTLAKTLNKTLLHQLKNGLPGVARKIDHNLARDEEELRGLDSVSKDKNATLLRMIHQYCRNFNRILDGAIVSDTEQTDQSALYGGARINYWFEDYFGQALRNFDPVATLKDHEVRTTIRNAAGTKPTLFVPDQSFEILVKKQIKKLEQPSLHLVDKVYQEILDIAKQSEIPQMQQFRQFTGEMRKEIPVIMQNLVKPLKDFIKKLIKVHCDHINTKHPDFVEALRMQDAPTDREEEAEGKIAANGTIPANGTIVTNFNPMRLFSKNHLDNRKKKVGEQPEVDDEENHEIPMPQTTHLDVLEKPSEREVSEMELIKLLIGAYFKIVMTAVEDEVRKAVMSFLVKEMQERLTEELTSRFIAPATVERLLSFSEDVQARHHELRKNVLAMRDARSVLEQMQLPY